MKKKILNLPKISIIPKSSSASSEGENIKKFYLELPQSPGVYIYLRNNTPIYIGKAINLKKRVSSYFRIRLETKTKKMISEAQQISYIQVDNELEALLLEAKLIKQFQPQYNVIAKDDKHPLYIVITKETYPRVLTARKIEITGNKAIAVYGPFPSSANVKNVLKMLRKIFPFSDHKIAKKPCLYSQIGLCSPCPNQIIYSKDKDRLKKIYLRNIRHIKWILDGKIKSVIKTLEIEMNGYSKIRDYENAAIVRNKVRMIEYVSNPRINADEYLENPNLYEDIRSREAIALKDILKKFGIKLSKLERIECYDVAHLHGEGTAASMVTFTKGDPSKEFYRHFRISKNIHGDDYASMLEVAKRRRKHLNDWGRPDLIVVDGGKGQLSVFASEFEKDNIPVIGLAKRLETLVIPVIFMGAKTAKEFRLPNDHAKNLLQRIRNEAHRFAQAYHHKLVSASLFERS